MKNNFRCLILCIAYAWSFVAIGQDTVVRAELHSDTVMVGHQFTLTYVAEGGQINNLQNPDLSAFNLLSGPNTNSSMSFINGQMSAKSSVNFVLQAREAGDFIIDSAILNVNGKDIEVEALQIHILKNPDGIVPEDIQPLFPGIKKPKKKRKTYKI